MAQGKDENKMDVLRDRLYARDGDGQVRRTQLKSTRPASVPKNWERSQQSLQDSLKEEETQTMPKKKKGYRMKLLVAGGVFFGIALLLSLIFLFLGNNTISGENISLEVSGPFAIGGAETVDMRVILENNNAVPIESATLIIEYPVGTQKADGSGQELFTERKSLDVIGSGQLVSEEFSATLFGEENAEKVVNVSVEYRVRGSNAVFYKEAEPLRMKISSSPIVLSLKAPRERTSGQDIELEFIVASNSEETLNDILISATYPFGFEYEDADPRPDSGDNIWRIDSLSPEERETFTVRGVLTGLQNEDRVFTFSAGVGTERDPFTLASVYAVADHEVKIDAPSLNVDVDINGSNSESVIIQEGQSATVRVDVLNTLDTTLNNVTVDVVLGGNILDSIDIGLTDGFFDSKNNTLSFDRGSVSAFRGIPSGARRSVSFTIVPDEEIGKTSEITLDITVRGSESTSSNESDLLYQTTKRTIQLSSRASLSGEARFIGGSAIPEVGEETQYAVDLLLQNGSNQLIDGTVTAVLGENVTLNNAGGALSYDAGTRTVTWTVGSVGVRGSERTTLSLSITPDAGDRGSTPILLETQRFKATNKFTGLTVRAEHTALAVPRAVE
ncbi:hypothetical protein KTR10_01310 [Candidatus Kaiserbacteria bacterium]|nr:hypothetical protein [Candidatus Kaiserbacteria bacterium]